MEDSQIVRQLLERGTLVFDARPERHFMRRQRMANRLSTFA